MSDLPPRFPKLPPGFFHKIEEKINKAKPNRDPSETWIPCDYCEQVYDTHDKLLDHMFRHSFKDRHVKCKECGKYIDKCCIRDHLKDHYIKMVYVCKKCGFKNASRRALVLHAYHDHYHIRCEYCQKDFTRREIVDHYRHCEKESPVMECIEMELIQSRGARYDAFPRRQSRK